MASWLTTTCQADAPEIHVAIEVPHGPVVETLMDRGFAVYASIRSSSIASVIAFLCPAPRTTVAMPALWPRHCAPIRSAFGI
jgi:hypothetical protein